MAEQPAQQQRQMQLRIDESHMTTSYANTIRTSTTPDEVVLDFGLNMPQHAPSADGSSVQSIMVFAVNSRVVFNWAGAKRLAQTMSNLVRAYEEKHGEISLEPRGGAGQAGG
jgi:hypothetical protein